MSWSRLNLPTELLSNDAYQGLLPPAVERWRPSHGHDVYEELLLCTKMRQRSILSLVDAFTLAFSICSTPPIKLRRSPRLNELRLSLRLGNRILGSLSFLLSFLIRVATIDTAFHILYQPPTLATGSLLPIQLLEHLSLEESPHVRL